RHCCGVKYGAGTNEPDRYSFASHRRQIALGVVGNQPARPLDLGHDLVAGIDAESALDALELRAVADVDSRGAYSHALIAIDAVATPFPGLSRLVRPARPPAPAAISDQQRVAVEHRALDARPGAHIDAHLLTRDPAEHIGGGGENADEQIGGEGRIEGHELPG